MTPIVSPTATPTAAPSSPVSTVPTSSPTESPLGSPPVPPTSLAPAVDSVFPVGHVLTAYRASSSLEMLTRHVGPATNAAV
ncbi:hypothetical protein L2E82_45629 [Cichorium intybus]|uniref:Uncharacterized protein n=1 Tax=Cichorium intybus TaxID=13427 RepID=A0ACB8ZTV0_CICIN|nr:hypothetical protein L2E82_45629 [Cichorium intybus]